MNFVNATVRTVFFVVFFTLVVFRSTCSKGFVDVFEVHSPFIVINVLKCNPKCNGLMACLL